MSIKLIKFAVSSRLKKVQNGTTKKGAFLFFYIFFLIKKNKG